MFDNQNGKKKKKQTKRTPAVRVLMTKASKSKVGNFLEDKLLHDSIIRATRLFDKHNRQANAQLAHDSIALDHVKILAMNQVADRSFDKTTLACVNQPVYDRTKFSHQLKQSKGELISSRPAEKARHSESLQHVGGRKQLV